MNEQVHGPFDVKRTAMETVDAGHGATFGKIRFEKRFHGALDATSVVEMLSAGDPSSGSAGYVAVEHVKGALQGRAGSFIAPAQRRHGPGKGVARADRSSGHRRR